MTTSSDIVILGAGVLGLCTAVTLAGRDHAVTVVDPGTGNASSVAAGMIAPASEALADYRASNGRDDRTALFRDARDLWPDFARGLGVDIHREGVEWRGVASEAVSAWWRDRGFATDGASWPFTDADWRIDPVSALAQMRMSPGLRLLTAEASDIEEMDEGWRVRLVGGDALVASTVVVAVGAVSALAGPSRLNDAMKRLVPIRGQLGVVRDRRVPRVVRGDAGYAAPSREGLVFGATMEPGRTALEPDPAVGARMAQGIFDMIDAEAPSGIKWRVGIRGATPDGLPMAGPSGLPGLYLALAPRRNGWLLGPLVGQIVADGIEGRAGSLHASALDPRRFL